MRLVLLLGELLVRGRRRILRDVHEVPNVCAAQGGGKGRHLSPMGVSSASDQMRNQTGWACKVDATLRPLESKLRAVGWEVDTFI